MEKISWKYVKKLNSQTCINEFLNKYNLKIPKELMDCLIMNNGGRPSLKTFDTTKRKDCEFKSLLSFNKNDRETIYKVYDLFNNTQIFPFGTDSAGNIICYDTKNKCYVFYNHEYNNYEKIINLPFIEEA